MNAPIQTPTRCPHGFLPGWCAMESCPHYGTHEGHAPIINRYAYCSVCDEAFPREEGYQVGVHARWKCAACYLCLRCRVKPRNQREQYASRYCQECFAVLAVPKPCSVCGELMYLRGSSSALFEHIRRTKHARCAVEDGRFTVRRSCT